MKKSIIWVSVFAFLIGVFSAKSMAKEKESCPDWQKKRGYPLMSKSSREHCILLDKLEAERAEWEAEKAAEKKQAEDERLRFQAEVIKILGVDAHVDVTRRTSSQICTGEFTHLVITFPDRSNIIVFAREYFGSENADRELKVMYKAIKDVPNMNAALYYLGALENSWCYCVETLTRSFYVSSPDILCGKEGYVQALVNVENDWKIPQDNVRIRVPVNCDYQRGSYKYDKYENVYIPYPSDSIYSTLFDYLLNIRAHPLKFQIGTVWGQWTHVLKVHGEDTFILVGHNFHGTMIYDPKTESFSVGVPPYIFEEVIVKVDREDRTIYTHRIDCDPEKNKGPVKCYSAVHVKPIDKAMGYDGLGFWL